MLGCDFSRGGDDARYFIRNPWSESNARSDLALERAFTFAKQAEPLLVRGMRIVKLGVGMEWQIKIIP